jgi:hypothetical protein
VPGTVGCIGGVTAPLGGIGGNGNPGLTGAMGNPCPGPGGIAIYASLVAGGGGGGGARLDCCTGIGLFGCAAGVAVCVC